MIPALVPTYATDNWRRRYPGAELPTIAVNLSAKQFQHPCLDEEVTKILSETGFDPRALVLEITESVVMDSAEDAIKNSRSSRRSASGWR